MRFSNLVNYLWYQQNRWFYLLVPASAIYRGIVFLRRCLYRSHIKKNHSFTVPIVVVGNVTVGGNGKTPFVIFLAELLKNNNYKPGIVIRGYGGKAKAYPAVVTMDSDPFEVGDEPLLLAKRTACPVVVAPKRAEAVKLLLQRSDCDIVISDDGLQHYALARDIEIALVDGLRKFGNGFCLPAGPLREPVSRLQSVNYVVTQGRADDNNYDMQLKPGDFINLADPTQHKAPDSFAGKTLHAVAGIAHPQRFFTQLKSMGLTIVEHAFPDHHNFQSGDFEKDALIIMTEKDAIKCRQFATENFWYLPVTAEISPRFVDDFLTFLSETNIRQRSPKQR
ncbi:MAG: tetraacyldisaccharide 4'-kinase [Gammaproteobacteria bacterium]